MGGRFSFFFLLTVAATALGFPSFANAQGALEIPQHNSFQSGVSNLSGWKCTAGALTASFLQSPEIRSPMGGNLAAFSVADSCGQMQRRVGGRTLQWNELRNVMR